MKPTEEQILPRARECQACKRMQLMALNFCGYCGRSYFWRCHGDCVVRSEGCRADCLASQPSPEAAKEPNR